jgi:hypothetical protein
MVTRRRVRNFTAKARDLILGASWPDGVTVIVDRVAADDQVFVYTPGGARTLWSLDPYDLASADPETVRATAIRRLEKAGHDPKFTEKSRAEDLALAALLRGES